MATAPHVTSGLGIRKFQADGFLLTRVYMDTLPQLALQQFCSPNIFSPRRIIQTVNVKESRNGPGVAQKVTGVLGSQISWYSAREGGKVVSLTHRPPLPPGMFLVLIFTRGWVDPRAMVRSEGNMSLKNPVTPPEIDPGTVRLVAQRLNHYSIPGPQSKQYFPIRKT